MYMYKHCINTYESDNTDCEVRNDRFQLKLLDMSTWTIRKSLHSLMDYGTRVEVHMQRKIFSK